MFKIIPLLISLAACLYLFVPAPSDSTASLAGRLKGRILVQVESRGEAWYIDPVDGRRYFLGRPADAFELMRQKGLGVSNADLAAIPLGSGEAVKPASDRRVVERVIDGDTVVVAGGEHVRLLAIDTDETGQACYQAAKDRLVELVLGKTVELKADRTGKDRYGRSLRHVFLDGAHINLLLVDEGLAVCRYYSDNPSYKEECRTRERTAKEAGMGCKWEAR
jgi:endonuclease YncB( thermonuclease family)